MHRNQSETSFFFNSTRLVSSSRRSDRDSTTNSTKEKKIPRQFDEREIEPKRKKKSKREKLGKIRETAVCVYAGFDREKETNSGLSLDKIPNIASLFMLRLHTFACFDNVKER